MSQEAEVVLIEIKVARSRSHLGQSRDSVARSLPESRDPARQVETDLKLALEAPSVRRIGARPRGNARVTDVAERRLTATLDYAKLKTIDAGNGYRPVDNQIE